jgi:hypothetical protein
VIAVGGMLLDHRRCVTGVTLSFDTVMLLEGHCDGEDQFWDLFAGLQRENDPACSNTRAAEANMLIASSDQGWRQFLA